MSEFTMYSDDILSVQDAAKELKKHRVTIYRWVLSGEVMAVKFGGVHYIPKSEIERLKGE